MALRLYSGNGIWIVVPDCMHASVAATAKHGSLRYLGEVDQARLTDAELNGILAEFDANSFAEILEEVALRLRNLRKERNAWLNPRQEHEEGKSLHGG